MKGDHDNLSTPKESRTLNWQKIFSRKNRDDPLELDHISTLAVEPPVPFSPCSDACVLPPWTVGFAQSVGRNREHNEDALFLISCDLSQDETSLHYGLYIVADGMGGHQYGELASGIAVRCIANYIQDELFVKWQLEGGLPDSNGLNEIMTAAVLKANQAIKTEIEGGGTTLTAVLLMEKQVHITQVGDSRAYEIPPDGELIALTHDHSFIQQLLDNGAITPPEAATHPQRNVLIMALGQLEPLEPQINAYPLPGEGHLLLCSDGLWGVVAEEQIGQIIRAAPNPQQACQELIEAANRAGGPDNITAIVVRFL
jgi:serine/threonine protein phosphatase PrpC